MITVNSGRFFVQYALCLCVFAIGCSGEAVKISLIPASGTVLLDGAPLESGSVVFRDDTGLQQAVGVIGADGSYELEFDGRPGAPAGTYRVLIFATETVAAGSSHRELPKTIVNKRYMRTETTPLAATVAEDTPPDRYDFSVTR